jgi:serine phosphatase RsbU (regulator of sigma subunit)
MADLRAAARAYVVSERSRPEHVMARLDALARATGVGARATLACLALQPATGELHIANAGHCPPLLVNRDGRAQYLPNPGSGRLGQKSRRPPEARVVLPPRSTLLLYTDGLVRSGSQSLVEGLAKLQRAATSAPAGLEDLCDHVLTHGSAGARRDDDISLLAARVGQPDHASQHRRT